MAAGRLDRAVVAGVTVVLACALIVVAFVLGSRMRAAATPASVSAADPTTRAAATPSSTAPSPSASESRPPVVSAARLWSAVTTGECLADYRSPWQTTYTVVACTVDHAGQVTRRIALPEGAYPGASELVQRLSLDCSSPSAVDLSAADRYDDIRIAYSYPTAKDWSAGDRFAYCFIQRAAGAPIRGSLAAG